MSILREKLNRSLVLVLVCSSKSCFVPSCTCDRRTCAKASLRFLFTYQGEKKTGLGDLAIGRFNGRVHVGSGYGAEKKDPRHTAGNVNASCMAWKQVVLESRRVTTKES